MRAAQFLDPERGDKRNAAECLRRALEALGGGLGYLLRYARLPRRVFFTLYGRADGSADGREVTTFNRSKIIELHDRFAQPRRERGGTTRVDRGP